jgi:hypothetical protein
VQARRPQLQAQGGVGAQVQDHGVLRAGGRLGPQRERDGSHADQPPQRRNDRGDQDNGEHGHGVPRIEPQPRTSRDDRVSLARGPGPGGQGAQLGDPPPLQAGGPACPAHEHQEQARQGSRRPGEQVQRLHEGSARGAAEEPGTRPPPAPDRDGERLGHRPQGNRDAPGPASRAVPRPAMRAARSPTGERALVLRDGSCGFSRTGGADPRQRRLNRGGGLEGLLEHPW